jgi:hypothetical protein
VNGDSAHDQPTICETWRSCLLSPHQASSSDDRTRVHTILGLDRFILALILSSNGVIIYIINHYRYLSFDNFKRHRFTQPIVICRRPKNQRSRPPNRTPIQLLQLSTLTHQLSTFLSTSQWHCINSMHPINRIHVEGSDKIAFFRISQPIRPIFYEIIGSGDEEFAGRGLVRCESKQFSAW